MPTIKNAIIYVGKGTRFTDDIVFLTCTFITWMSITVDEMKAKIKQHGSCEFVEDVKDMGKINEEGS